MRRRKRNPFVKIGILCLSLILALGVLNVSYALWSQTLHMEGTVTTGQWDEGGTPGFWKNWDTHNTYTEEEIEAWLVAIDGVSAWLDATTVEEMETICYDGEGGSPLDKFLRAYLATRLNDASGRLNKTTVHYFSGQDPSNYLGIAQQGTLPEIIAEIESKYGSSPTGSEFLTMKNICDALNNLGI